MSLALVSDFDLSARNTLALTARSRFGVAITDGAMLPLLFETARAQSLPVRILGFGSNVVLAPRFDGITALMALKNKQLVSEDDEAVVIEAAAGEIWHDLVLWTVEHGLGGLENLALIPGTVGAAPVQNIGAYGAELADVFDTLVAYDRATGTERTFSRTDCAFGYRDSIFKHEPGRYVVISVRLRLPKAWTPNLNFAGLADLSDDALSPKAVMNRVIELRSSKLPDWRINPNAGSFFQNPIVSPAETEKVLAEFPAAPNFPQANGRIKLSAGWLIEKAGLKGFTLGPVGMSERHALVVVNHGGADQGDIAALAAHVKETVKARFGVQLYEEPIFM
jgi:UDP-N-acetylmuramate dehydrogenase